MFRRRRSTPPPVPVDEDQFGGDPDARRLHGLMLARDWPSVEAMLSGITDHEELTYFVYVAADVPHTETWLADIARTNLDSLLLQLLYGSRAIRWAWDARGAALARHVGADQFDLFFERLRIAEDALQGVVRRDPGNATAWTQLVVCARGLQLGPDEARSRFERVVATSPYHLTGHRALLQQLCRKWGGSHELMHDFARSSMLKAPEGNALGVLVPTAHIEQWLDSDDRAGYMRSPQVRSSLREAADRSVRHPAYRPGRGWAVVHNTFAMAFAFAEDHERAAEQFKIIGDVRTDTPWAYTRDPGVAFASLRQKAYDKAGV